MSSLRDIENDNGSAEDFISTYTEENTLDSLSREFQFMKEDPEEDPEFKRFAKEQTERNKRNARRLVEVRKKMQALRNGV
jgi:hypothetical protein